MTHASVFSGIGGPEVAAAMLGWENLFHCEINPFGRRVLDYWFPNSKSYGDITTTDFSEWRGRVNVLTGGFPCQPFSYAGKRGGAQDDRYLWPFMFRCIDQIRPDWVVAENVAGILTMVEQGEVSPMAIQATLFGEDDGVHRYRLRETFTLQRICDDLESHGYSVQPILITAASVGAPHRRDRVFIVANSNDSANRRAAGEDESKGRQERLQERHEVRQSDQPNQVRPTGEGNAPTDSIGSRERTSRASGCTEGCGSDANQQSCEWRTTTEWSDRFYAILRHAADSNGNRGDEMDEHLQSELADGAKPIGNGRERNATDTSREGLERQDESGCSQGGERLHLWRDIAGCRRSLDESGARWAEFPSVSPIHRGNDGIPIRLDNLSLSFGKWRSEALKAYGNAIVPQVMYEIFRAIEQVENQENRRNETGRF